MDGRRGTNGKKNGHRWQGKEINWREKWVTGALTHRTKYHFSPVSCKGVLSHRTSQFNKLKS